MKKMRLMAVLALAIPLFSGMRCPRSADATSAEGTSRIEQAARNEQVASTPIPSEMENGLSASDIFSLRSLYSSLNGYQYYHASSYDLDGGNLDGFYFDKQEGIAATTTMLDVNGPGVMTSFWAEGYADDTAKEVFHFYLDGELLFSAKHEDLFGGKVCPFVKPYVGIGGDYGGGCYFYVPLVFQKSLKITAEYLNYYNIDYVLLPSDAKVHPTSMSEGLLVPEYFSPSRDLAERCDGAIVDDGKISLNPGEGATLLQKEGDGLIQGFTLNVEGIADAKVRPASIAADGRFIKAGGNLSFRMDLRPDNEGCYLKYRVDAIWPNQVVGVYCDDQFVTEVDSGAANSDCRILDLVAKIPSSFTEGKSQVAIKLECVSVLGIDLPFFDVWMYSIVPGGSICTDYLDILNGSSESNHDFAVVSQNGSGSVNATLADPAYTADLSSYPFQTIDTLPQEQTGYYSNVVSMRLSVTGTSEVRLVRQAASKDDTSVNVWVDGKKVGAWNAFYDGSDKVGETSFTLPLGYVSGKTSVVVSFVPIAGSNNIASLRGYENGTLVDCLSVADGASHALDGVFSFASVKVNGVNSLSDAWEEAYEKMQSACDYDSLVLDSVLSVYTSGSDVPDICLPLSVLFNMGVYGFSAVNGYAQGMDENGLGYFYLPLPYEDGIRITLVREAGADGPLNCAFAYAYAGLGEDDGPILTLKSQIHQGISAYGTPLPWLTATGSGKLVGLQYNCAGPSSFAFLEGDEIINVDGNPSPVCNGTGTEDIFKSAWYFVDGKFSQGTVGMTWRDYPESGQARISAYRSFLTDQVIFRDGIEATIEHGPSNDTAGEHYCIAALYYSSSKSALHSLGTYSANGEDPDCVVVEGTATEGDIEGRLEGNAIGTGLYSPMRTLNGTSELRVRIPANNDGILIRRLYDLRDVDQKAEVYCDGSFVNVWMNKYPRGEESIARYDDFIIPASFTRGKGEITIDFVSSAGSLYEESEYGLFSLGYDFDPDYAMPDTDGDGIKDLYDEETIVKGTGLDCVYSYEEALAVKAFRKTSTLSEEQRQAALSLLPDKAIIDAFDLQFVDQGADYEFATGVGVRVLTRTNEKCSVVFFDEYGSMSVLSSRQEGSYAIFSACRGGSCLILA
ncbi:MAG: DUF2961 domain-containing protein [Bacilli bacterium]|jgi:hypothetical protein|nr:DUF2961 domain-containing protein [Bacilli bacterium]